MADVTVVMDERTAAVLLQALDTYQRVLMGQWREVADRCVEVLGENAGGFSECADALMDVRCQFAQLEPLREYRDASLGVAEAGEDARRCYDLWHALGGGMKDRQSMRLTDAAITVTRTGR